jgi:murein DD-endopeptidase MepM/ murein hydrolase activator NlpD
MEDMGFDDILTTLKQLFQNVVSRQDKREHRATSFDFKGYRAPLRGALHNSGGFDPTGKGNVGRVHQGIDLRAPGGTPVFPIAPGTVTKVYNDPKGGNAVVVKHDNDSSSYYAHMGTVAVHNGDTVDYNTVIGTCGASGNAKGFPHVHLQVWRSGALIDPASVISVPPYTVYNAQKEKLWMPGAKAVADNWHLNDHLNTKRNKRLV